MMPWRLAYWPVRMEARLGEQIGVVWKARSKIAPSRAMRSMCGVFMYGWPPAPNSSKRRSSIRMMRKLGRLAMLKLIGADAGSLDHLPPALVVGLEVGREIAGRAAGRLGGVRREALPDFRACQRSSDIGVELRHQLCRQADRSVCAPPLCGLESG